ncbi:MAG: hypothetical protein PHQ19_10500 [Candidatus Krumholzibacteria bacterium]|nr:hypothetical protein [Candidatus Krumholzibacteria bacterium]
MFGRTAVALALALMICTPGITSAIAPEHSPLRFGVKLGLNISDFKGNDTIPILLGFAS